jgi:hypothetical protein
MVVVASVSGEKCRLVGDLTANGPEGADKGQPVGVDIGLFRGFAHEMADGVVGEQ